MIIPPPAVETLSYPEKMKYQHLQPIAGPNFGGHSGWRRWREWLA